MATQDEHSVDEVDDAIQPASAYVAQDWYDQGAQRHVGPQDPREPAACAWAACMGPGLSSC